MAVTSASQASSTSPCIASPSASTSFAAARASVNSCCPASTYLLRSIMSPSSTAISRSVLSAACISSAWIALTSLIVAFITSSRVASASAITASPSAIASSKSFCTDSTQLSTSPFATCSFALFRKYSRVFLLTVWSSPDSDTRPAIAWFRAAAAASTSSWDAASFSAISFACANAS